MRRQLVWSASANRDLARLDRQVAARLYRAATRFAETGHGDFARLRPPMEGYRLRVGDWRLLVSMDDPQGTMEVVAIRHRREAYRSE